jgi:hypothetical protein
MNIADRARFYSEAYRVLKSGGRRVNMRAAPNNGEEMLESLLAVLLSGAGRADDHFLGHLFAFPTRVIRVMLFALALLVGANEGVGPGTILVLLTAPVQDQTLRGSPGRDDALTQLTAKHGKEPMD